MFNLLNLYACQLERPRIESAEIAEQGFPILNLFSPPPLQFLFLLGGGIIVESLCTRKLYRNLSGRWKKMCLSFYLTSFIWKIEN